MQKDYKCTGKLKLNGSGRSEQTKQKKKYPNAQWNEKIMYQMYSRYYNQNCFLQVLHVGYVLSLSHSCTWSHLLTLYIGSIPCRLQRKKQFCLISLHPCFKLNANEIYSILPSLTFLVFFYFQRSLHRKMRKINRKSLVCSLALNCLWRYTREFKWCTVFCIMKFLMEILDLLELFLFYPSSFYEATKIRAIFLFVFCRENKNNWNGWMKKKWEKKLGNLHFSKNSHDFSETPWFTNVFLYLFGAVYVCLCGWMVFVLIFMDCVWCCVANIVNARIIMVFRFSSEFCIIILHFFLVRVLIRCFFFSISLSVSLFIQRSLSTSFSSTHSTSSISFFRLPKSPGWLSLGFFIWVSQPTLSDGLQFVASI